MSYFDAEDKELKLFYARLDDLERASRGGEVTHSAFLTPSEAYKAEKYFAAKGNKDRICFFGGYNDAIRKQIFLLPEYLSDSIDFENNIGFEMLEDDFDNAISAFKIVGSGFRKLTHRDYLGSILSLGIVRATLGDILILDDFSAIVFCSREIESFISCSLESIGNDRVKLEKIKVDRNMQSSQRFQEFSDTVASERLDCVVAAIFNLSRERAQSLIKSGMVEYNYEEATRIDVKISGGDIISARGYGKFIIKDVSQATKKGRLRLFADKYV